MKVILADSVRYKDKLYTGMAVVLDICLICNRKLCRCRFQYYLLFYLPLHSYSSTLYQFTILYNNFSLYCTALLISSIITITTISTISTISTSEWVSKGGEGWNSIS